MIPYARQSISDEDVQAVVNVLRSDFLTQGPVVPEFEGAIASFVGADACVAVNSATSGLHIACLALGVGPNDVVWTSAISFVASANCARMCGAQIDFVDIDPRTFNISLSDLEKRLQSADERGVLPKVLIVVHMAGQAVEMREIARLCSRYSVLIIEDASHAIGAEYGEGMVGCCEFSAATVFSFHPVKIITTGEGGAVTTNSQELAARMRLLRSHGVTRDAGEFLNQASGSWYYEQQELGFNYRMSDFAAALGISQLSRIGEFIARRNQLAMRYSSAFAGCGVTTPEIQPDRTSAFHLYILLIAFESFAEKALFFDSVRRDGVSLNVHYRPIYQQPYYQYLGYDQHDFPEAESYYQHSVSIPMYTGLTDAECDHVVDSVLKHLPARLRN